MSDDMARCVSVPLDRCMGRAENPRRPAELTAAEFWPQIHAAWRLSTDLANWGVHELIRLDVRREPGQARMPAMAGVNLYTHWNATAPVALRQAFAGATGSAASIIRWVHRKYKQDRFRVVWQGQASYASYRYAYPWPVRAQEWRLSRVDGNWFVSVTLPGGRFVYSLCGGPKFDRQASDLSVLLAEPTRGGELRLCPRHSGGRIVGVMARFSGAFPRAEPRSGGVARFETCPDRLLSVAVPGRRDPFLVNFDHVPQLVESYQRKRQRLAEDTKFEKRWPAWKRRRFLRVGEVRAQVRRDRVRTALQQAAACAVGFAARQGCVAVEYDDSERSYLPEWPWVEMRSAVRFRCEASGLSFQPVGGTDDEGV